MAEHTALPWQQHGRFVVAKGQTDTWDGPVWGAIARAEPLSADDSDGRHWTADGDEKANAEFIVRAVNSHYQLVEALEGLLARWDVFTGPERNGWGNMEEAYYDLAKHATAEWKAARALLSSLKGTDNG